MAKENIRKVKLLKAFKIFGDQVEDVILEFDCLSSALYTTASVRVEKG